MSASGRKKILLVAGLALPALAALLFGGWYFLEHSLCANRIVKEERSPNGKLRAVYFTRQCSNDQLMHHLSIFDSAPSLFDARTGNLVIDDKPIEFRWKGSEQLEVIGMPFLWQIRETFYGVHVQYGGDE